jgi:hypothetical protein
MILPDNHGKRPAPPSIHVNLTSTSFVFFTEEARWPYQLTGTNTLKTGKVVDKPRLPIAGSMV